MHKQKPSQLKLFFGICALNYTKIISIQTLYEKKNQLRSTFFTSYQVSANHKKCLSRMGLAGVHMITMAKHEMTGVGVKSACGLSRASASSALCTKCLFVVDESRK